MDKRIASTEKITILGASTGRTAAIKEFLTRMPADVPGILTAQHMPEIFTKSVAASLDCLCKIKVVEAQGNEGVLLRHASIAPGHSHLLPKHSGANCMTELSKAVAVSDRRPSVEVLFGPEAKKCRP